MSRDSILTSVGIDIGTTTTKLVISYLTLSNVMPGSRIPRIEISGKSLFYASEVRFTPFIDRGTIDEGAVRKMISEEYQKAGISPDRIDTGAIIITGESAKKENAEKLVHALAEFSGDFVVATAGPELESIIAGKGSGTEDLSRKERCIYANIDIGGGTTNIAYYDNGACIGNACLEVGGRLIEIDLISHKIKYMARAGRIISEKLSCDKIRSDSPEAQRRGIDAILTQMVQSVDEVLFSETPSEITKELTVNDNLPKVLPQKVVFSGGVSRYIYQKPVSDWWIHGDVGPLLAEAYKNGRAYRTFEVVPGAETIHATVMGAGIHTVNVSGSTVTVKKDCLPIRNIPVVVPEVRNGQYDWIRPSGRFLDSLHTCAALSIPVQEKLDFQSLDALTETVAGQLPQIPCSPKVVVMEQDIAKFIGQGIRKRLGDIDLVCIDGIRTFSGDYIDIGKALSYAEALPVVVKTLIFNNKE
ncbi:MAG TPA: ethanolamine ammonia-lyase reactivating factor EutA [Anaerovoracaceae bacterium]|nr:ethanolamine ammonia-lyase reactivating factor EutA [Anaerovoracaceae bacterium]